MKTIFDVIDHNMKNIDTEPSKVLPIFRIQHNDGYSSKVALSTHDPINDSKWLYLPEKHAIDISFIEKEPGVISTRKHKKMEMALSMVIRDTYIPRETVIKVEVLKAKHDMEQLVNTVAGLRKTIEDAGKEEPSIILE